MEHEQHTPHSKQPNAYLMPVTIIVAAILVCATLLYSSGAIASSVNNLAESGGLNPPVISAGATVAATASPTPTERAILDQKVSIDFSTSPIRGDNSAPTTLVVFEDFQCPVCGYAAPIFHDILANYSKDVNLVIKHFPLDSLHPEARKAGEAYECARDQGKQFEFGDALFDLNNKAGAASQLANLSVASLKKVATELKLDATKFNSCLDSGEKASVVEADYKQGVMYGVGGTPTTFIVSKKDLDYAKLEPLITASDGAIEVLQEQNGSVIKVGAAFRYAAWELILGALK